MLSPYRVLDLTGADAELGPMILADLGADVIKVEPPGGSASRTVGARMPGAPEAMSSLRFHVYNRNKRSVTIDLASDAGKKELRALVRSADFLFESGAPGAMTSLGVGFEQLREVNPGLVYVAVTPFGQTGPYALHHTSDLTLAAMGGMMALNGDRDRSPVRITVPQTWHHAAAESALAALVAHHRRMQTGEGQFVDVSVQASVFWTGLNAMIAASIQGKDIERAGTLLQLGVIDLPLVFEAKDGQVVLVPTGATTLGLVGKMAADGVIPEFWLTGEDWATYDLRFLTGQPLKISLEEVVENIGQWTAMYTKGELLEWGLQNGVTIAPASTIADVLTFRHLKERQYWMSYPLPGGRETLIPGPFVRLAETPLSVRRLAPEPGEHNEAVRKETKDAPPRAWPAMGGELPFEGLKVADFSWIGVGPITAKYFADHGATVVRVETTNPPDRLRGAGPHKDGIAGVNRSQFYAAFNTSKKGMVLNLKHPAGHEVAKRLLEWCDIAIESFTPGTMADLGLSYETAKALNPKVIMVSSCLMGQTGPAAKLAGYGYHAAAISGFFEVTGWPDRPPGGPFNAYTDVIAPHFLAATVMAALDHRRRTGEGQYIEQAQMESALHFLAPELAAYQVNGTVPRRAGNEAQDAAPHNAFPCAGDDRWIAIAVQTDAQWAALREVMGNPPWAADPALGTLAGRLGRHGELDDRIAEWTAPQERFGLMAKLQAAGVPAGVVQKSSDLVNDPQLAHRRFFHPMVHPEMGEVPYEGHMFAIEGYASGPLSPAPCLGEHTFEVLTEILGMTEEEAAETMASGAVGV